MKKWIFTISVFAVFLILNLLKIQIDSGLIDITKWLISAVLFGDVAKKAFEKKQ